MVMLFQALLSSFFLVLRALFLSNSKPGTLALVKKRNCKRSIISLSLRIIQKKDPLLLWLDGGPGCSALNGFFLQNGPLALKFEVYNGSIPSLVSTTYSWTKMANIIYVDQPVRTGFSYSRSSFIDKPSDTGQVKRMHEFLQKWLSKHPQFLSNPFYACGTSYAGMVIPALVQEISKGNYICCEPPIYLQGYILSEAR